MRIIYPGRAIRPGETDRALVRRIQRRLNSLGCGPIAVDGAFGPATRSAVRLFQARFADIHGHPLKLDGVIGPATWTALFGPDSDPVADQPAPWPWASPESAPAPALLRNMLVIAASQIGVTEEPPGSNSGPTIDTYLRSVGLGPGYPWCAAFVYWCFEEAAAALGCANPAIRTGSVLGHWKLAGKAGARRVRAEEVVGTPSLIRPGSVFCLSAGAGKGHMGLVERSGAGSLTTIEGNTNAGGSREGIGVFRRTGRKITQINLGFIDYGAM